MMVFCVAICAVFITLIFDKSIKINSILLSLLFICFISLLRQPEAQKFHAWERLGFFAIMLCLLSPLIKNRLLSQSRPLIWRIMMWCFRFITLMSLCIYIASRINIPGYEDKYLMSFCGITPNGMALAPICCIVLIDLIWRIIYIPHHNWVKGLYIIATVSITIMMIHAGSRITIAGGVIAIVIMAILSRHLFKSSSKRIKTAAVLGISLLTIVCVLPFVNETIQHKLSVASNHNSLTYSRDSKWTDRITEFKSAPLTGIGYSTQTAFGSIFDNREYVKSTGHTEPGSSWLSVLAQTGIIGFILIVAFNVSIAKKLSKNNTAADMSKANNVLLLSLLIFLWIHGVAEGWILYPGAYMFFPYWLLSGLAYNNSPDVYL